MTRDRIYTEDIHATGFRFDGQVARVFDDMIQRSVPGYGQTLQMIQLLAHQYAQPESRLYDLGCSLGAAAMAMARGARGRDCRILAVDNSEPMIERCRQRLRDEPIEVICGDILECEIRDASLVVMNFVLQFIEPEHRRDLLARIHAGMRPGGVLVLSEKIRFEDEQENRIQTGLHEAFKRAHGYSEMEISRKRNALEKVLIPETLSAHHQRFRQAGFEHSMTWFQCFNFASMLAFR